MNRDALMMLEIDRISLDTAGVDQLSVNRLYQGLYATSMGFYGILNDALLNVRPSKRY